jgi:hypothetical protein
LFADNLNPNEAKFLGSQHNADTALTKTLCFMELLAMARDAYLRKKFGVETKLSFAVHQNAVPAVCVIKIEYRQSALNETHLFL